MSKILVNNQEFICNVHKEPVHPDIIYNNIKEQGKFLEVMFYENVLYILAKPSELVYQFMRNENITELCIYDENNDEIIHIKEKTEIKLNFDPEFNLCLLILEKYEVV